MMSAGDYAAWALQLVIVFPAPVFVGYWVHYQGWTVYGENTDYITSATIVSAIALVPGAFIASVFGDFVRGLIHGAIMSFIEEYKIYQGKSSQFWNEAFDILKPSDNELELADRGNGVDDKKPQFDENDYQTPGQDYQPPTLHPPQQPLEVNSKTYIAQQAQPGVVETSHPPVSEPQT